MPHHAFQLSSPTPPGVTPTGLSTDNTHFAAVLMALGVGAYPQVTRHMRLEKDVWTWHLDLGSATWPDLSTKELMDLWVSGRHLQSEAIAGPVELFFVAGMHVLEARKCWLDSEHARRHAKPGGIHVLKRSGNLSCVRPASEGTAHRDLGKLAMDSQQVFNVLENPLKKAIYAGLCFGFPVVRRTEAGYTIPAQSLTWPGLTATMLAQAAREIHYYNAELATRQVDPPKLELPGAEPGYHPLQFGLQALHNFEQLLAIVQQKTPITAFLQNARQPEKSALVRVDSSDEELAMAAKHTGVKL